MGFKIAIEILQNSQGSGKNNEAYVQFNSICKIRGAYFNVYRSEPQHAKLLTTLKGEHGRNYSLITGETESYLFNIFMPDYEHRMGRQMKQYMRVSVKLMIQNLKGSEKEWCDEAVPVVRKR